MELIQMSVQAESAHPQTQLGLTINHLGEILKGDTQL